MDFNLLQAFTGRKPRSLDHLPLTRRYAVRIAGDNAHLNNEGQRTIPSLQTLSRLTGSWKVCFLECLQGVILRNGMGTARLIPPIIGAARRSTRPRRGLGSPLPIFRNTLTGSSFTAPRPPINRS